MKLEGLKAYYYDSDKIQKDDIIWGLLELGVDVVRPEIKVPINEYTEEQYLELEKSMESADFVITQNFSMIVAEVCHQKGMRYISWIYDSPQTAVYHKEAFYSTNYIFVFDRTQLKRLKEIGLQNVYYQPLAANMAKTAMLNISDEDIKTYGSDVSFVGRLYKRDYYHGFLRSLDSDTLQNYQTVIEKMACKWEKGKSIFGKLGDTDQILYQKIMSYVEKPGDYAMAHEYIAEVLIFAAAIAKAEREKVLKVLGNKFQTLIFTDDLIEPGELPGVEIRPEVSYDSEMFKVFFSSRINLNLTMRAIETGVPQRVFDIMSVGGFVMSNYQEEMEELFVPDREIIVFHDMDEMMDKAGYYLSHEKKRVQIAMAGYKRVSSEYNYPESLKKMLKIAL